MPTGPSKPFAPPTGPQAGPRPLPSPQPFAKIPHSPTMGMAQPPAHVPTGPRATQSLETSPKSINPAIPTGPRADRFPIAPIAPIAPRGVMSKNLQWIAPGRQPTAYGNRPSVIPAKRDVAGEEKEKEPMSGRRRSLDDGNRPAKPIDRPLLSPGFGTSQTGLGERPPLQQSVRTARNPEPFGTRMPFEAGERGDSISVGVPPEPQSDSTRRLQSEPTPDRVENSTDVEMSDAPAVAGEKFPAPAQSKDHSGPSEDDDAMDLDVLDEEDFKDNETKYTQELAKLESKLVDVTASSTEFAAAIEELSVLNCVLMEIPRPNETSTTVETVPETNSDVVQEQRSQNLGQGEMLTPKEEQDDETKELQMEDTVPNSQRESRSPTPNLPYLSRGPPTPLSDPDQDPLARYESHKSLLMGPLIKECIEHAEREEQNKTEYQAKYADWKRDAELLDEESVTKDTRQKSAEPGISAAEIPASNGAAAPGIMEGRRGLKFASDYELQRVMELSAAEAKEKEERNERESLKAKPDYEREAEVPDLCEESVRGDRAFWDTNHLELPEDAAETFQYVPPKDDFSYKEHLLMVENYRLFPKKWSKIAQALQDRDFKQCINHYYATKWDKEYKVLPNKRGRGGRRGRGGGRAPGGRPSALSAAGNVRPDTYEGDEFSAPIVTMTDTGRPRRAAAPTWPPKEDANASKDGSLSGTSGRKSGNTAGDSGAEKTGKRRKNAKEKVAAKPKTPAVVTKGPTSSPQKTDKDGKERAASVTIEQQWPAGMVDQSLARAPGVIVASMQQQPGLDEEVPAFVEKLLSPPVPAAAVAERTKAPGPTSRGGGTSSYWSKQEKDDTVKFLQHFGTDFVAISARMMKTKTPQMVYSPCILNSVPDN